VERRLRHRRAHVAAHRKVARDLGEASPAHSACPQRLPTVGAVQKQQTAHPPQHRPQPQQPQQPPPPQPPRPLQPQQPHAAAVDAAEASALAATRRVHTWRASADFGLRAALSAGWKRTEEADWRPGTDTRGAVCPARRHGPAGHRLAVYGRILAGSAG
jgi:hypothetical protein